MEDETRSFISIAYSTVSGQNTMNTKATGCPRDGILHKLITTYMPHQTSLHLTGDILCEIDALQTAFQSESRGRVSTKRGRI